MNIQKIDALELLQSLGDKTVDLILTDPPYYKLLNIDWDKQWKKKDNYLNWLENIIKECQRVLKDNGSFYMFCSSEMSWYVEGLIRKHFNVLNHIRWCNTGSMSFRCKREELRKYLNPSEEIIFAEQFVASNEFISSADGFRGKIFEPIRKYLDNARTKAKISKKETNEICNVKNCASRHYFDYAQWVLPTEEHYDKLREHMDLKPYEEIKQEYDEIKKEYDEIKKEYESLRRTFNLSSDKPYNNTWNFKQTPTRKGRHPCEKPMDLISHIIDVSSNENNLVVDMFCGSCVVPKCCEAMNRRCIAGDIDNKYFP